MPQFQLFYLGNIDFSGGVFPVMALLPTLLESPNLAKESRCKPTTTVPTSGISSMASA